MTEEANVDSQVPNPYGWDDVAQEMGGWHPAMQEHAQRHLDAHGVAAPEAEGAEPTAYDGAVEVSVPSPREEDIVAQAGELAGSVALQADTQPADHETVTSPDPAEVQRWIEAHGSGQNADFSDLPSSLASAVVLKYLESGLGAYYTGTNIDRQVDVLPPLNTAATVRVIDANRDSRPAATRMLLHSVGTIEAEPDFVASVYHNPGATTGLMTNRPELARFMADTVADKRRDVTILEKFDDAADDPERTTLTHHAEVLQDPEAQDWAKNVSHAIISLPDVSAKGFGTVTAGEVNWSSSFKPEDNIVTNVPIPTSALLPHVAPSANEPVPKMFQEMTADERQMILRDDVEVDETRGISFADLNPGSQEQMLGYVLRRSIARSQDEAYLTAASARNLEAVQQAAPSLHEGDLLHSARVNSVEKILANGLVCGELVGEMGDNDAYPFNVDFNQVAADDIASDFAATIKNATAERHDGEDHATITYVLGSRPTEGGDYPDRPAQTAQPDHRHRLVFGAVPATEVNMIVLSSEEEGDVDLATESRVVRAVIESGTYYPVVSNHGKLLLTYDDFLKGAPDRVMAAETSADQPEEGAFERPKLAVPEIPEPGFSF